jgi:hypothetical protein
MNGCSRTARCQPRLANISAYGKVALVSACVEMRATAPGILVTQ